MPVVCDMSSDIGSRKVEWKKYGVVYAGAQKNLGAAGVTVVIVREDLIGNQSKDTPFLLNWDLYDKSPNSYFNTPATYPIYVTGLNIAHMLQSGGLEHYEDLAEKRSSLLYEFIDTSNGFYSNPVDERYRSKINVPIRIRPEAGESSDTYTRLELKFIKEAEEKGFMQLKGHSKNPGIRVSMYNAMPLEGVQRLCAFMERFMHENSSNPKLSIRTRVMS
jgi:phosphoserine aminotransferase